MTASRAARNVTALLPSPGPATIRALGLLLGVYLGSLYLGVSVAWAGDVALPDGQVAAEADPLSRLSRSTGLVVPVSSLPRYGPGRSMSIPSHSSADTIAVFQANLETLSSPSNEGGWTHVDDSFEPTAWNISNIYSCGSNAFWCGVIDSSWTGDPNRRGYANSWSQTLENFADLAGGVSPYTISFQHRMNVESGFDKGIVEVLDINELWIEVAQFTGNLNNQGQTPCGPVSITIPDSIVARSNPLHFRFRFESDVSGSSEDGLYSAGEGWAIDDVEVKAGLFDVRFFDDMEAGIGTWTRSTFPAVGDYWKIAGNVPTEQVCTANSTKVWKVSNDVTGGLVTRLDDLLLSPPVAVGQADQVFLFFDVYRNLSLNVCFYYGVQIRTKNIGAPSWSAWADPTGLLYFGSEREWLQQTVPLAGAGNVDSLQFRLRVKDWGPVYCGGSQGGTNAEVLFDNFVVGVLGSAGPTLVASERDLYQDTFKTTAFFGNDNFNTPTGDSVVVRISASNGLSSAAFRYSLNGAAFVTTPLTAVGSGAPGVYFADIPAGAYPRGSDLRYYFTATDLTALTSTLPADAETASHYYRATILPAIHTTSGLCPNDTARVLYVNSSAAPNEPTKVSVSLTALGLRYDRYDVNAAAGALGNGLGGATGQSEVPWPATPASSLSPYRAIVWDVGDRSAGTITSTDQTLIQGWLSLLGANRGIILAGENLAYDLAVNGVGPTFLNCVLGATYLRDIWENTPQDTLVPNLVGPAGTRIAQETFPVDGGCPVINRFDATTVNACVGSGARAWLTYPNSLHAATERLGALGAPGGDSLRTVILGFSLESMTNTVRRNLLLYRTIVDEFEIPACYPATGVGDMTPVAAPRLNLRLPAPNPFNPHTTIRFDVTRASTVQLRVFDVGGALVRTLVDRHLPAGEHRVVWDGRDDRGREVGSGAYFLRLSSGEERAESRKVVLLR